MSKTCDLCPRCNGCRRGHFHCRQCRCGFLATAKETP